MALLQAEPAAAYIPVTALLVLGAWRLCSAMADTVSVTVRLVRGARRRYWTAGSMSERGTADG
jgi:hypothetical protein